MAQPLLSARGVSKRFAGVEVLSDVDLDLGAGEIHALLGENGAGKSTFAKILAGVHRPTRGTLRMDGRPLDVPTPLAAQRAGITLIHQEPVSFPDLSVAENLVLGRDAGGLLGRVRWGEIERRAAGLMDRLGIRLDVTRPMRGLSIASQQMVEIARALDGGSRLIVMDEPTAPLTPAEVATLFDIARQLRSEGCGIVFVSHRLEEVRALCDRATVFRDGRLVGTGSVAGMTDDDIIRMMIGRSVEGYRPKHATTLGAPALEVDGLDQPGAFHDIGFTVREGEIVGLAGLVGAGRTDVARAIFGIAPARSGTIRVAGRPARIREPSDAIALGLAFVPEDRAQSGIFGPMSVEHNITAAVPDRIAPRGFIRRALERALARESVERLRIRLATLRQPIMELSGGNQQKAILARWLHTDPRILILDEPTRGIDVGVKAEFYDRIGDLAEQGRAILLISSELPELLALCDRILVMSEGRLTADLPRAEATQEAVMRAAVPRGAEAAA